MGCLHIMLPIRTCSAIRNDTRSLPIILEPWKCISRVKKSEPREHDLNCIWFSKPDLDSTDLVTSAAAHRDATESCDGIPAWERCIALLRCFREVTFVAFVK